MKQLVSIEELPYQFKTYRLIDHIQCDNLYNKKRFKYTQLCIVESSIIHH